MIRNLINEKFVFTIIVINAFVIFLNAFPSIKLATNGILFWIDYLCALYFIIEMLLKIKFFTFRDYWANGWNRFDFIVVIASSPVLLSPIFDLKTFSVLLILRLSRILRLFKILTFIPNRDSILTGIVRALKASIGVFIALIFLNFLFAMGATLLFSQAAPEYFGNPFISFYSLFKIFTIEGWYEIPDILVNQTDSLLGAFFIRFYFVISVLIGGILGLSLANAVFVDEMTADNTAKAENLILELKEEIKELRNEIRELK
jgi:voltage-gated sodium channel